MSPSVAASVAGDAKQQRNAAVQTEPEWPADDSPLQRLLVDFGSTTTVHGVPRAVGSASGRLRLFWALVFCLFVVAFSIQLVILVKRYFQYEKTVEQSLSFELMAFPAVTFCSLNPYVKGKAEAVPQIRDLTVAYEKAVENLHESLYGEHERKRRGASENEIVQADCYADAARSFFVIESVYQLTRERTGVEAQKETCMCVNDQWNYVSYCAPPEQWIQQQCRATECSNDNYCGAQKKDGAVEAGEDTVECVCNQLYDGCYASLAAVTTTSTPGQVTHDYSFVFANLTDEMAVQESAKETLLYIGGELDEATRRNISYTPDYGFVRMCSFGGRQCDMQRDFTLRMDPHYGNCYTFNGDGARNSSRAGATYGLKVMAFADVGRDYLFASDSPGVRVAIHSADLEPFPEVFGYSAPNGFVSSFGVRLKNVYHLEAPYGDCVKKAKTDHYLYPELYSLEGCYRSCYQERMTRRCDCSDPRMPVRHGFSSCPSDDVEKRECLDAGSSEDVAESPVDKCNCPLPCLDKMFMVSFSGSLYPTPKLKLASCNPPDNETCLAHFRDNAAVVQIYFQQLNYEVLTEFPSYAVSDLLSDLGGTMGLWLGASVMTSVEFVWLFYQLLTLAAAASSRRRRAVSSARRPSSTKKALGGL